MRHSVFSNCYWGVTNELFLEGCGGSQWNYFSKEKIPFLFVKFHLDLISNGKWWSPPKAKIRHHHIVLRLHYLKQMTTFCKHILSSVHVEDFQTLEESGDYPIVSTTVQQNINTICEGIKQNLDLTQSHSYSLVPTFSSVPLYLKYLLRLITNKSLIGWNRYLGIFAWQHDYIK